MEVLSRSAAKAQGQKWYFTGEPCKEGHVCERQCSNGKCRECDKATTLRYREANRRKISDKSLEWYYDNYSRVLNLKKEWAKANADKCRAKSAKRRAAILQALPGWADLAAIEVIYKTCPDGCEVDHYYPLKSDWVCGLHVAENLRHLPIDMNRSKGNRRVL